MIAIDLDDSLLGSDLEISQENKDSLFRAIEQGVVVTIATGRMFCSTLPYARQLGLDVPLITYNGGLVKNALSHDTLFHCPIPLDVAQKIVRMAESKGAHIQAYIDDDYYMDQDNKYSEMYRINARIAGTAVGSLMDFMDREPTKFIIIDEPEDIKELASEFKKELKDLVQVAISKPYYLEFTNIQATKGKALEYLAGLYKVSKQEIIAIGDSYNDISMLEYAGLGVAMGNSPQEIKKQADYVTGSNDDNGVAQVINKFILKGGEGL